MSKLKEQLDLLVDRYNRPEFIPEDPVSVPHSFRTKQDKEISGFIAATISWGNRRAILNSAKRIMEAMDSAPYDFVMNHSAEDLKGLEHCKHRTFQTTDLLYFIAFLRHHYSKHSSLESAFFPAGVKNTKEGLIHFHNYFFSLDFAPQRTRKHVSTPIRNSACKRLNMFLRWMVRNDKRGVDFGLWKKLSPAALIIPMDVHVVNSVNQLLPLSGVKANWKGAETVTAFLKELNHADPAAYDFALFGFGIDKKQQNKL